MTLHPRGRKIALSIAAVVLAGVMATSAKTREIPAARQGKVDAGKAHTPNGGRPEIRSREEMKELSGYTAPGALAYADLAAEAGAEGWPVTLYYRCKNRPGGTAIRAPIPKALEVFDKVYSIGDDANNIWAIDTAEGIILLDALSSEEDAKSVITKNMHSLGLDPARIRYILVTHSHLDHFGGVAYLKSLSRAKVGMAEADWTSKPTMGTLPVMGAEDFYLTDGQEISLGGRTITVVLTPGHTPGTVSFVFPVSDKGSPHVAALFGGQGSPKSLDALLTFRRSLTHFADYTDKMQADVILSNHTVGDDGLTRIDQLTRRKAGEPNPYVVGRAGVIRYDSLWRQCLSADIDQIISAKPAALK